MSKGGELVLLYLLREKFSDITGFAAWLVLEILFV